MGCMLTFVGFTALFTAVAAGTPVALRWACFGLVGLCLLLGTLLQMAGKLDD